MPMSIAPAKRDVSGWPSLASAWTTVVVLTVAYTIAYTDRLIISLLIDPIKADLALSDTQISLIVGAAFAIFYSVFGLPIARYADRGNRRVLLIVSALLWSLMTFLCGLAVGFWTLFIARIGVAIGEASIAPSSLSLIADNFPAEKRSLPISIWVLGAVFASVAAYGGGGVLISDTGPLAGLLDYLGLEYSLWRAVFMLLGILGVPLAFLIAAIKEPARHGVTDSETSGQVTLRELKEYVGTNASTFLTFFVSAGLALLVLDGCFIWLPSALVRIHGMSLSEAGAALAVIALIFGLIGPLGAGYLNQRFYNAGHVDAPVRVMLILVGLGCVGMFVATLATDFIVMMFGYGLVISGLAGASTLPQIAIQLVVPNNMRAQISAGFFFLANIVGFGMGPTSVAIFNDYVFRNEAMIVWSMFAVGMIFLPIAIVLLFAGLVPFRKLAGSAIDAEKYS